MGSRLDLWCRLALIAAGAAHAWGFRHDMNPDGMTYLDMASLFAAGDPAPLANATFSPLYSLLIAAALALTGHDPTREFAAVHAVNFACYAASLVAFEMLLCAATADDPAGEGDARVSLPVPLVRGLGYALFAWATLKLVSLSVVTPDMLLSAFFFAAAALTLANARERRWGRTIALGLLCGTGYWVKAIFFYLSLVFLFLGFFGREPRRERLAHTAVALALFLLVAGPLVARISMVHGRPTVGESGKLNLIWWVTHTDDPPGHFVPSSPEQGTPVHPLKVLHEAPRVYAWEFETRATYALWYDASWWHAGRRVPWTVAQVVRHVAKTAKEYWHDGLFRDMACLLFGWVVLVLVGPPVEGLRRALTGRWRLLIAGLVSPAMYALVHSEARYVASSMVVIWLALYAASAIPRGEEAVRWARALVLASAGYLVAIVVPLTVYALVPAELREAPGVGHAGHLTAAGELARRGLTAGDKVAVIGNGINGYWARLARVRIVAEVDTRDVAAFWAAPAATQAAVLAALASTGAKAVLTRDAPAAAKDAGWAPIAGTPFMVRDLSKLR